MEKIQDFGITGRYLFEGGRDAECFIEAARIDPDNPTAHYRLAQAYRSLNRSEDAPREMNTFLELRKSAGADKQAAIDNHLRGRSPRCATACGINVNRLYLYLLLPGKSCYQRPM